MNERIKELEEQCWTRINFPCFGTESEEWEFDSEKFAELIVEECVAQCWTVSEMEHKGSAISECSKRMRKHFGVE